MTSPTYRCDGVTKQAHSCKRAAVVSHLLRSGTYLRYCAQHEAGGGVMRLLGPAPWEIVSTVPTRTEV